jgi:hypothetical protein
MADFRLSKGDGIEFKRKFVEIRERLVQLATAWSNGGGGSAYFNHSVWVCWGVKNLWRVCEVQ